MKEFKFRDCPGTVENSFYRKHLPTKLQIQIQSLCRKEYYKQLKYYGQFDKIHEYDFNRGWEYGYGMALKMFNKYL